MRDQTSRLRWRDQRDTLVARRHRRRRRRRDITRPGEYEPVRADSGSASRGVRTRLLGAIVASGVTLICLIVTYTTSLSTFGGTFALSLGLSSFGAVIALVLSARHEEQVHALASQLEDEMEQLADRGTAGALPAGHDASAESLQPSARAHRTETAVRTRRSDKRASDGTDGSV